MTGKPYLEAVRQQYEALPYPPRDPADETRRLVLATSGNLLVINHHCFGGRRDFRRGFRCLVAGGGTGDTTIFLAEQLRHSDAEVVYLDLSTASRAVAEARARVRGLGNITWITASILDLPQLGLGRFDYIECCGVLHHLESTEAGLAALNTALADDGAIFLMLYGRYGRRAVYDMQQLLRELLPPGLPIPEKIRLTRQLLATLPATNGFARDYEQWRSEIEAGGLGDAGLYDLLLHSQDRCFDVPQLYQLAADAGLQLLSFAHRADAYDPRNHIGDAELSSLIAGRDLASRQALAEQLVGNLRKHEFFLARQAGRGATLADAGLALRSFGTLYDNAPRLAADMQPGRVLRYTDPEHSLPIRCTPITQQIYAHMDGGTSIGRLREHILAAVPAATPAQIDQELQQVYDQLHPRGYLYLIEAGCYGISVPDYGRLR